MKSFRLTQAVASVILAGAALTSCGNHAVIKAEIEGASSSEIVLRQQNVSRYDIIDTLKTDASGRTSCKVELAKGDPDFFYLYYKNVKIASLLLERGDKVTVKADTLGNYEVSGSEETLKLQQVDREYGKFSAGVDSLAKALVEAGVDSKAGEGIKAEIAKQYTGYYRQSVRYVMENCYSLSVIPVFYQTVADSFYLFSQDTDAIHFSNAADSLSVPYPDSKYVRALREEAKARKQQLELKIRMQQAESVGFPDLSLPDQKGQVVKLSDVDSKVILVHFWTSSDAVQKMFNLEVLKGIYEDYHDKGLEIYQVAIDMDKPSWARVVEAQDLKWINVCDGMGANSPAVRTYNITGLPVSFIIADGQMTDRKISDEASLRKVLNSLLK